MNFAKFIPIRESTVGEASQHYTDESGVTSLASASGEEYTQEDVYEPASHHGSAIHDVVETKEGASDDVETGAEAETNGDASVDSYVDSILGDTVERAAPTKVETVQTGGLVSPLDGEEPPKLPPRQKGRHPAGRA
jgi:hypothetical protein